MSLRLLCIFWAYGVRYSQSRPLFQLDQELNQAGLASGKRRARFKLDLFVSLNACFLRCTLLGQRIQQLTDTL